MKKLFIFGGIIIVVIVAAAFLLVGNLNTIIQKGVEKGGPVLLKAPVSLNKVDIDLKSGSGEFTGLTIGNPEGYNTAYAFNLGNLKIDLDIKSVTSDKIHIKNLLIDAPLVIYEQKIAGNNNLSQLQENIKSFAGKGSKKEKSGSASSGKKMQIDYLKITNASVSVSMDALKGQNITVPMRPLEIKNIGTTEETTVAEALEIVLRLMNRSVLRSVQNATAGYQKMLQDKGAEAQQSVQEGLGGAKDLFK